MRRLLFLPLLLALFLGSDLIITRLVEWKIKHVFEFESCSCEKGVLTLESPVLGEMRAKRLVIKPTFHLLSWALELKGVAIEPEISLQDKSFEKKSRWIHVDWNLAAVDGKLELADGKTLRANGVMNKGHIRAYLSSPTSHVGVELTRGETTILSLDFCDTEFSLLDELLPKRQWSLEKGLVNGKATVEWRPGERPIIDGHLKIIDASAKLFPWSIGSISGELSFVDQTVSLNVLGAFGHGEASCLFFARELPTGEIALTVKGPMKGIEPMLPTVYRQLFTDEAFSLDVTLNPLEKELHAEGTLTIDKTLTIPFGATYTAEGPKGWFKASGLDASTYIQPLLKGTPDFSGRLDLEATFDAKQVAIHYVGHDIVLESDLFKITANQIEGGTHQFGLNGEQSGSIPLTDATYLEKKTGLFFDQTSCQVRVDEEQIHIENVHTLCNAVMFCGSVVVEMPNDAPNHLYAQATSIEGEVKGAQQILAHICPSKVWNFPVNGRVGGELLLDILFTRPYSEVNATINGVIEEAGLGPLQNISTSLTYEQENRILTLIDLSGTAGEQHLNASQIQFQHFPRGDIAFDLLFAEQPLSGKLHSHSDGRRELMLDQDIPLTFLYDPKGVSDLTFGTFAATLQGRELHMITPLDLILSDLEFTSGQIQAHVKGYALGFGIENGEGKISINETLTLYWQLGENPLLTRLHGTLDGISLYLVRDHRAPHDLFYGSATINSNSPHFPEKLSQLAGGDFELNGSFSHENKEISFAGNVRARDYTLRGFKLDYLIANLEFSPTQFTLSSLLAAGQNGRFTADLVTAEKLDNQWNFSIPLIEAANLKPIPKTRPNLIIDHVEISNIEGTMETLSGDGYLIFHNPPKRDLRNTLLAFPDDLLGRIGLDFGNLIPASGRINYTLDQGIIHFTKFDHVYSHAQRSQFFLEKRTLSTMDLTGNLDVKVRMRHYNIILKLTELFTVSVGGNLSEPSFRLLQPHTARKSTTPS